jgi:hypothetical protein
VKASASHHLQLQDGPVAHLVFPQILEDLVDGLRPLELVHLDGGLDAVARRELEGVLVLGLGRDQAGVDVVDVPEEGVSTMDFFLWSADILES